MYVYIGWADLGILQRCLRCRCECTMCVHTMYVASAIMDGTHTQCILTRRGDQDNTRAQSIRPILHPWWMCIQRTPHAGKYSNGQSCITWNNGVSHYCARPLVSTAWAEQWVPLLQHLVPGRKLVWSLLLNLISNIGHYQPYLLKYERLAAYVYTLCIHNLEFVVCRNKVVQAHMATSSISVKSTPATGHAHWRRPCQHLQMLSGEAAQWRIGQRSAHVLQGVSVTWGFHVWLEL